MPAPEAVAEVIAPESATEPVVEATAKNTAKRRSRGKRKATEVAGNVEMAPGMAETSLVARVSAAIPVATEPVVQEAAPEKKAAPRSRRPRKPKAPVEA